MYTCTICHFRTELDDAVVVHVEQCICLRCYGHETGSFKPMPRELREMVIAALGAIERA